MTIAGGWRQLVTSSSKSKSQCPKLFYNFAASPKDGIALLLTDLISLWRDSASRSNVLASAIDQHTSIDPSESNGQFRVLLDKLATSLETGRNKLAKESVRGADRLLLKTCIDLPKPLKPLEWTFTLMICNAAELAEDVLRPTLHQLSVSQQKLDGIFNVLKEKDHVIEKLLDRVADKGIDMSLIFPTLTGTARSGGSGVKVEDAKRLVPGMRAFEKSSWEKTFAQGDGDTASALGLGELVKGCEKCFAHSDDEHRTSMSEWFRKLPGPVILDSPSSKSFGRSQSQSQPQTKGSSDTESENEFETQATPPNLKKRRSPEINEDASFSDDARRPPAKKSKTSSAKIGGLRKKEDSSRSTKTPEESFSPARPSHTSPARRRKSDSSTATETESDSEPKSRPSHEKQSPTKITRLGGLRKPSRDPSKSKSPERPSSPARPPTASSNASTPARRLGRIGKSRQATASPVPDAVNDDKVEASQTATPSRKLGRLGMRNKENESASPSSRQTRPLSKDEEPDVDRNPNGKRDDSDATASTSPSPSPTTKREPPSRPSNEPSAPPASNKPASRAATEEKEPEPETEAQKAERRREELKRTTQAAAPKKKRRF